MSSTYVAPNIRPSGGTWAQLKGYGFTGQIEAVIAVNAVATTTPTAAPTATATGGGSAGGAFAAGAYLLKFTEINGVGETAASPESTTLTVGQQANPTTQATATPAGGGSSGGALAAGTYYVAYAFIDSVNGGTTTLGTSESAVFTVVAGDKPTVTLPALPAWAASINVYLTAANGSSGTEVLYLTGVTTTTATLLLAASGTGAAKPTVNTTSTSIPQVTFPALKSGNTGRNLYVTAPSGLTGTEVLYATNITTTTYSMAVAAPVSTVTPPTASTTAISTAATSIARDGENRKMQKIWDTVQIYADNYLQSDPVDVPTTLQGLLDHAVGTAMILQTVNEIGVLIAANPGTIATTIPPSGAAAYQTRTLP